MHLDVNVSCEDVHRALEETFLAVLPRETEEGEHEKKKKNKRVVDEIQKNEEAVTTGGDNDKINDRGNDQQQFNRMDDSHTNRNSSLKQLQHDENWK